MNGKRLVVIVWIGLLALASVNTTFAAAPPTLPDEVVKAITAGLLDEYHAYNTYQAIIDEFGKVRPFVNIQKAEAQHIAALKAIFTQYGAAIPAQPNVEPLALPSVAEACQAGAAAEIANYALYDGLLEAVKDYPDILRVMTVLRNASEFNHLPAFEHCAARG
jgi:hypothetical protein